MIFFPLKQLLVILLFKQNVRLSLYCMMLQELFLKLTRMASIATDMLVGRERFATLLLMRLSDTVILWLSEDQAFWEEIEAGQVALGAFGLRQVDLFLRKVLFLFSDTVEFLIWSSLY